MASPGTTVSSSRQCYHSGSLSDGSVSTHDVVAEFFANQNENLLPDVSPKASAEQPRSRETSRAKALLRSLSESGHLRGNGRPPLGEKTKNETRSFDLVAPGPSAAQNVRTRTRGEVTRAEAVDEIPEISEDTAMLATAPMLNQGNQNQEGLRKRRNVKLSSLIMPPRNFDMAGLQSGSGSGRSRRAKLSVRTGEESIPTSPLLRVTETLVEISREIDVGVVAHGLDAVALCRRLMYPDYERIGRAQFFPDGAERTWALLSAFMCFSHVLGINCDLLDTVLEWTVRFISENISEWIVQQGGWVSGLFLVSSSCQVGIFVKLAKFFIATH